MSRRDKFHRVAIAEIDDAPAIRGWLQNWNQVLHAEVSPVLDDAETKALGRKKLGWKETRSTSSVQRRDPRGLVGSVLC
jgi:hypothetical protein